MIAPANFLRTLQREGVRFFAGVPDSLLKDFCAHLIASVGSTEHVTAANEGTAVAIAAGHHLATGSVPLVYFQNSGLGNAVNPLLSLVDPDVYALPLVLLVGWRGEPGSRDEPQHVKQGRVTPTLLSAMEIPYRELTGDERAAAEAVRWAVRSARERGGPVVLLARKGIFDSSDQPARLHAPANGLVSREHALELITPLFPRDACVVATTGHISRELHEQRRRTGGNRSSDFLTIGSMGHASQIALGIAMATPRRPVICLDGDGAMLMHLGGVATAGTKAPGGFKHIVLNNGVHDSVGGQPTVALDVQLSRIADACGYRLAVGPVTSEDDICSAVRTLLATEGPAFLEIRIAPGSRPDLGRPRETPLETKRLFMAHVRSPGDVANS